MAEHRPAWSAAWGVVMAVSGTGAAALWIALTTGGSWWFLLPAVICSLIAGVGLYCMFAVLAPWWPFNALDEPPASHAPDPAPLPLPVTPTPAQTEDSRQPIFDEAPPELADMSPASLQEFFAGRTGIQAQTLLKQHAGKHVRVSGEVKGVDLGASGVIPQAQVISGAALLLLFADDDDSASAFRALNVGDRIVASGDIYGILKEVVSLTNCKLIDVRGRAS